SVVELREIILVLGARTQVDRRDVQGAPLATRTIGELSNRHGRFSSPSPLQIGRVSIRCPGLKGKSPCTFRPTVELKPVERMQYLLIRADSSPGGPGLARFFRAGSYAATGKAVSSAMRYFRDQAGIEWRVFLTARGSDAVSREHSLPEAYREGWLVFESAL